MRPCLRSLFLALFLVLLTVPAVRGAEFAWLVVDRLPQALPSDGTGLLIVGQEPATAIATVAGDLVSLLEVEADGALLAQGTFLAGGPLSAVAVGDVDQDGRWELVTARGEEGAVSVDRWVQGQRLPVGMPRYAWTPVKALQLVATRSGKMIVAAGQGGGLISYLVSGRGLEPAGVSEPKQRFELYGAADLDGDGQDELVAGAGRSEVAVFRWTPGAGWTRWWQNFPWGGTVGAAVGDLEGDGRPELVVASGERLLYVFGADAEGTGLTLRHQSSTALPAGALGVVYVPPVGKATGEGGGLPARVAVYRADEVRLLSFSEKMEALVATVAMPGEVQEIRPLAAAEGAPADVWPRLLLRRPDGTLETVAAARGNRLRLEWLFPDGRGVPAGTPLVQGGKLYVSMREVASQLGVVIRWDDERRLAEAIQEPGERVVELIPGQAPRVDGRDLPEAGRVVVDGGKMFLEARAVERLFSTGQAGRPRLMVVAGTRQLPVSFLW